MEEKKPKVSKSLVNNYALTNGLNALSFTVSMTYVTMFMTDYLGINPVAMANAMLITRLGDFFISIVAGVIIEKSNMKHGKYLSWLRILTVTLLFGNTIQMLDTTAFVHNATVRLFICQMAYLVMGGSMNFWTTTRAAILPKFCGADMELRKDFTARQSQVGAATSIIGSAITLPLVTWFGRVTGHESQGYFMVALLFAVLFVIANVIFCKQAAPFDPPAEEGAAKQSPTIRQMVSSLVTNKQMLVLFFCFSIFTVGNQLYATILAYFFRVTGHFSSYTVALTARSIVAFLATLAAPPLARKLGKKSAIIVGWGIMALCGVAMKFFAFTNGEANIPVMIVLMCVWQGAQYIYMSFQAVYWLDCGEYGYYTTGIDNRTMAVTVMNWPTKIGFMLGGSLGGWLLAWAGYDATAGAMGAFASMDRYMDRAGPNPRLYRSGGGCGNPAAL